MDADIARFRTAERERLIAARLAMAPEVRAAHTAKITARLEGLLGPGPDHTVSVYWPIRGEPDLRPWMREACARGLTIALPVAKAHGQPLTFRPWHPGAVMARGLWKIPYPAEGPELTPTTVLAPLVGFDTHCHRLGYGGGFFDRTLATLKPQRVIGIGYQISKIATIRPQPHDVPMDLILTEEQPLPTGL